MIWCPYCELEVYHEDSQETRGRWLVHRVCQLAAERRRVFLTPNGDLFVGQGGSVEASRIMTVIERTQKKQEASGG